MSNYGRELLNLRFFNNSILETQQLKYFNNATNFKNAWA